MSPPLPLGFDAKDWVAVPRTIATARRAAAGMIRLITSTSLRQWRERRFRRVPDSTDKGSTSQVGEEFSATKGRSCQGDVLFSCRAPFGPPTQDWVATVSPSRQPYERSARSP